MIWNYVAFPSLPDQSVLEKNTVFSTICGPCWLCTALDFCGPREGMDSYKIKQTLSIWACGESWESKILLIDLIFKRTKIRIGKVP